MGTKMKAWPPYPFSFKTSVSILSVREIRMLAKIVSVRTPSLCPLPTPSFSGLNVQEKLARKDDGNELFQYYNIMFFGLVSQILIA